METWLLEMAIGNKELIPLLRPQLLPLAVSGLLQRGAIDIKVDAKLGQRHGLCG